MPPPHRFLAPRLRGYVCKACLSKSQTVQRRQPLWLSRNASNGGWLSRLKGAVSPQDDLPDPSFREFEQGPDGERVEIREDVLKEIENEIARVEKEEGKTIEEIVGPLDFEKFLEEQETNSVKDPIAEIEEEIEKSIADKTKYAEEMEALVKRLDSMDLDALSPEERSKLREELLRDATTEAPSPQSQSHSVSTSSSSTPSLPYLPENADMSKKSVRLEEPLRLVETKKPTQPNEVPVHSFAPQYQAPLEALNTILRRVRLAARGGNANRKRLHGTRFQAHLRAPTMKEVWKAYLLSRSAISTAPSMIPHQVFLALWDVFSIEGPNNLERMAHIKVLGEDFSKAGLILSPSRHLLYIEAIFVTGDKDIAIGEWEAAQDLQENEIYFKEYCELGVRMFCQVGNFVKAIRVAEVLVRSSLDPNYFRIVLPIMQAYLDSETEEYPVHRAWALYIRLRAMMGPYITMDDYDAITAMFLKANQLDLALGAFKDMMLTGSISAAAQDSTALYKNIIHLDDQLSSLAIQSRELYWPKTPREMAELPVRMRNGIFFGSWVKKLIGEGQLDAAHQVFDLMRARKIKPIAKHMNGLIGAWFREGTERSRRLAEDLAWRMIQARIDFVKARDMQYSRAAPLRVVSSENIPSSLSVTNDLIPAATIETFAILIQQYRQRQKPNLVSDLLDAQRSARIRPNTSFMNELLLCDMRAHHTSWAWDTYFSLTREYSIRPDFDTYEILWNLMKRAMDPVRNKTPDRLFTCRTLFADMVQRQQLLTDKGSLPRELYDLIILSFSLALDHAGTAVALRALQRHFGIYPSAVTTRTIVMQLSRLGLVDGSGRKPKRLRPNSPNNKERIANVTRIFEMFKDRRVEILAQQGIAFNRLGDVAQAEELLLVLSDLLRYADQARIAAEERHNYTAVMASKGAAEQMGVTDSIPWEAHSNREVDDLSDQ